MTDIDTSAVNDNDITRLGSLGEGGDPWDRWVLSSESWRALDVYATRASRGRFTCDELLTHIDAHGADDLDPEWLARLGRILVSRPDLGQDYSSWAHELLHTNTPKLPRERRTRPLRILNFESLFTHKKYEEAKAFYLANEDLQMLYHRYMGADLLHPHVGLNDDFDAWQEAFNRPQAAAGLWPITADLAASVPFNTMRGEPQSRDAETGSVKSEHHGRDPLVTVIVTTYAPDPEELRHAVRSLSRQTWTNLEILLIDDASPDRDDALLDSLAAEDDRIRVIRLQQNGGTYRARNVGILEARGDLVTGQDTDDWSHPQRIERQVRALQHSPTAGGVVAWGERINDCLFRTQLGFMPGRRCEITFMYRRRDAVNAGGYLRVRKAADSEFRRRMEEVCGIDIVELEEPLYAIRPSEGSLSRADFRPGWSAPHRRAFWSACHEWHTTMPKLPPLSSAVQESELPFPVPARISGVPTPGELDVCFIADLRQAGAQERAIVEEMRVLADAGLRVGVLHLDSPYKTTARARGGLQGDAQALINEGRVRQVLPDESVSVHTVIVRELGGLEFARHAPFAMRAVRAVVVVDATVPQQEGAELVRLVGRLEDAVERVLDVPVSWAVQEDVSGGAPHEALDRVEGLDMEPCPYPRLMPAVRRQRREYRAGEPLRIGTDTENVKTDWPAATRIPQLFPMDDSQVEVRVLGDGRGALRAVRRRFLPPTWIDMRRQVRSDVFWGSVDVAVFAPDEPGSGAQIDSILTAVACGVPVFCSDVYVRLFGSAVMKLDREEPLAQIRRSVSSHEWTVERADTAVRVLEERFGVGRFLDRVRTMIPTDDTPSGADHV